jgi:Phage gp6-like head-tail connector protein
MHSILDILGPTDSSVDLISLDDLKLALGIEDSSEDAQLQAMITFQSRIIAEYCDRRLAFGEALETFTFDPGEMLPVRQALTLSLYPVAEILEVSTAGATSADYDFDPASGRLWTGGGWTVGEVAVVYSGGYLLPDEAPARLQQAVIQAINESRTSGTRDPSIRELQHGDTRISYFTSSLSTASSGYLSAPVTDLIKPYRRLYVA